MKRQNLTQESKKVMWAAMAMSVLMTTPCFAGRLTSTPMVQAQTEMVPAAPISESDFIVSGNNSVTAENGDNSILTIWSRIGYAAHNPSTFYSFVNGDSLITARGITFGNTSDGKVWE